MTSSDPHRWYEFSDTFKKTYLTLFSQPYTCIPVDGWAPTGMVMRCSWRIIYVVKMPSEYQESSYGDKTIARSCYHHNGDSHTIKTHLCVVPRPWIIVTFLERFNAFIDIVFNSGSYDHLHWPLTLRFVVLHKLYMSGVWHPRGHCWGYYIGALSSSRSHCHSQIPQCTSPTYHNAQFLQQKCAHVCIFLLQNGALWDICRMRCAFCEMSLFIWKSDTRSCNELQTLPHAQGTTMVAPAMATRQHVHQQDWLQHEPVSVGMCLKYYDHANERTRKTSV